MGRRYWDWGFGLDMPMNYASRLQVLREASPVHDLPDEATTLATVRLNVHRTAIATLGPLVFDVFEGEIEDEQRTLVRDVVTQCLNEDPTPMTRHERQRVLDELENEILGFGPLEGLLRDETVSEVMVNGHECVYVERNGVIEETDVRFINESHFLRILDKIVTAVGRRIDEGSPMVDARMADGSRVNAILPPLAIDGACLTIRKFRQHVYSIEELISSGTMHHEMACTLTSLVRSGANILVSGGTSSGKTTLLNALAASMPPTARIVTVEDAAELRLPQPHVIRLETRPPNLEGKGEITVRDLVRNCLRMRPDRIVIGECRGAETLDMLQALNTGHGGCLTTIHANSTTDAVTRLETLVLSAGADLPARVVRDQIVGAIDVIVHLERGDDGKRRVIEVAEIDGVDGDRVNLIPLDRARDGHGHRRRKPRTPAALRLVDAA
jgi:pilus assembly protein CpaF